MLREVPYEPTHLYSIECRPEQVALWKELIDEGLAERILEMDTAFTLLDENNRVVVVAGVIQSPEQWGEVYTFLGDDFQKHLKFIIRWLKAQLDVVQLKFEELYAMGRLSWPFLPRWMAALDFFPVAPIPNAGRYGESYMLYRRKPWQ